MDADTHIALIWNRHRGRPPFWTLKWWWIAAVAIAPLGIDAWLCALFEGGNFGELAICLSGLSGIACGVYIVFAQRIDNDWALMFFALVVGLGCAVFLFLIYSVFFSMLPDSNGDLWLPWEARHWFAPAAPSSVPPLHGGYWMPLTPAAGVEFDLQECESHASLY